MRQIRDSNQKRDIWFRAETRCYMAFTSLVTAATLLLSFGAGTIAHRILVDVCLGFSMLFGSIILVSQFKHIFIRSSYIDPTNKSVFVTGCASGFGKELVKRLDTLGFTVFAGVRHINDDRVKDLLSSCSKRVIPVKIDVTDNKQVKEAASFVRKYLESASSSSCSCCLWSIVCNAGVYSCQGFDWGPEGVPEYERIMNANTFGSVRVVKAFLPLLKQTPDSRIVINSSISSE